MAKLKRVNQKKLAFGSLMSKVRKEHGCATNSKMNVARINYSSVKLHNGDILVMGGVDLMGNATASTELYSVSTKKWLKVGSMTVSRYGHTATLLPDGRVLVAGGGNGFLSMTAELYDPVIQAWRLTALMGHGRRNAHTATLLLDGRVLVIGGCDNTGSILDYAEIYDPSVESWSRSYKAATGFAYHCATRLNDGRILVSGGYTNSCEINDSYIFDPAIGVWTVPIPMIHKVFSHASLLLADGDVLVTGGYNVIDDAVMTTQRFDTERECWLPAGDMRVARVSYHQMAQSDDGKVLVMGGEMLPHKKSLIEIYNTEIGAWE